MRVTLLHNPTAGAGSPSGAELMAWLADSGYEPAYQSTQSPGFARALDQPGDLVVVAGGDGTVATIIRLLAGRETPVGVVPLGTANNIAWSLGLPLEPAAAVAALPAAAPRPLDVAMVRAPWGGSRFVESAGLGLFASVLRDAKRDEACSARDAGARDLASDRGERMRRVLERERAMFRRVAIDGEDRSGQYLFVAAFNIPFIGPRLPLAPEADPGDGLLDVLLVGEDDRRRLETFLDTIGDEVTAPFPIPTLRCRHLRMDWDPTAGHLDDGPWPELPDDRAAALNHSDPVTIAIHDRPVTILAPAPPR
jgi:diacylglycerol kinase (ATP)